MKALSVRQPFASLLIAGMKHFETRDWALRKDLQGTKIALHASKTYDAADRYCTDNLMRFPELQSVLLADLPLGGVLGIIIVEAVYRTHELAPKLGPLEIAQGDYRPGRAAWKVKVIDVFPQPVPAVGKLGLWEWANA